MFWDRIRRTAERREVLYEILVLDFVNLCRVPDRQSHEWKHHAPRLGSVYADKIGMDWTAILDSGQGRHR